MVNSGGDKTVREILLDVIGSGEEDAVRVVEGNLIFVGGDRRFTSLNEQMVEGAEGVQDGD